MRSLIMKYYRSKRSPMQDCQNMQQKQMQESNVVITQQPKKSTKPFHPSKTAPRYVYFYCI